MGEPMDPYGGRPYAGPPPGAAPLLPATGYAVDAGRARLPNRRPGSVIGAAVLAFVAGGLLLLAAVVLFSSARFVHDLGDAWSTDSRSVTNELSVDAIVNLCAAALFVPGGVLLLGGRVFGQTLLAIGSVVTVAATVYWVIRAQAEFSGTIVFAVLFGGLAVVAVSLAYAPSSRAWLAHVTAVNSLMSNPYQFR